MIHRKTGRKFGRTRDPRRALLKNLAASLVLYEKVKTTDAKAKEIRGFVEPLITKGKTNSVAVRRYLLARLPTENAVKKVLEVLGPRYQNRAGGYTRIVKLGRRQGDGAPVSLIELI